MTRRLSLLLAILALTACTLPFASQPTAQTAIAGEVDDPARIGAAHLAQRDQVALAKAFKKVGEIPTVARTTPLEVNVGDVETFWVTDFANNSNYQVAAMLRYAGPVVLMYVDTSIQIDQADVEKSAKEFEQRIYPRDRELFGQELSPGIDGDPRLTVLNTPLNDNTAGYFSSAAGVVKAVNPFSNEREMFIMGSNSDPLGSDGYLSTLAHEFQHTIEWNVARRSPSWFNEGMSTLAQDLNGYVYEGHAVPYLQQPDLQLTTWSSDVSTARGHYGASQLFLRYFTEQYAGEHGIRELIAADAGNDLAAFVPIAARKRPDIKSFAEIYADWAVANVLNDPAVGDGRYAYTLLPGKAAKSKPKPGETTSTIRQFGVDYYGDLAGPLTCSFDGGHIVGLAGALPKGGRSMWWSNRGDESVSTLTHEFDLTGVKKATLQFSTWYEIELDWDYAFVTVSTDGGKNWTTLKGKTTSDTNPQGQNFGNGLTGVSGSPGVETDKGTRGQWIEEQMDLTPFAGQKMLLRFWVVNDAEYNAAGMLIDDIRIPELNYSDGAEDGDGGWQPQGFVRTTGKLPQTWALRLIRTSGGQTAVEPVPTDGQGRAAVHLADGETGVLAVIGTTPFSTEPATYTYTVAMP